MRMLKVKPNQKPICVDIDNELEALQREVGGYIEIVCPFEDNIAIICNEEGKLYGLPMNRWLYKNGICLDFLCGDILVAEEDEEEGDFVSMSDEHVEKYMDVFSNININMGDVSK